MSLPAPVGLTPAQARSHVLASGLLLPLVVVLAVIVTPFYLLYDTSKVSGTSMLPTLRSGEYLLITRGWSHPVAGDLVVLMWTHGRTTEEIVKRVVAVGGDRVRVRGDVAQVDGAPERFPHQMIVGTESIDRDLTVPAGSVYVLGDNRPVSLDSRFFGPLPVSAIHGRVVAVWAPVTSARVVPSP